MIRLLFVTLIFSCTRLSSITILHLLHFYVKVSMRLGPTTVLFIPPAFRCYKWAPSSEFVSSSIPSWQISIAHAQPFRGARGLAFCLKVTLDSLLVWASSEGSGETARMRSKWNLVTYSWLQRNVVWKCQRTTRNERRMPGFRLRRADNTYKWAWSYENVPYTICEQQRRRSACASAQFDQHLCCSLLRQYDMYTCYIQSLKILASFCSWADWFEPNLVESPRRHVFAWCGSNNNGTNAGVRW